MRTGPFKKFTDANYRVGRWLEAMKRPTSRANKRRLLHRMRKAYRVLDRFDEQL